MVIVGMVADWTVMEWNMISGFNRHPWDLNDD